jgi:hypothetical protein
MGYLNTEKPPEKWSPAWFKLFLEKVRTAVNFLDEDNFPDGISGLILKDKSVPFGKLSLTGLFFFLDFFTLALPTAIAATAYTNLGGSLLWSPKWASVADVFLEYTAYITNASAPCDVKLVGVDGTVTEHTLTNTAIQRFEMPLATMPATTSTLIFQGKTSNATYPLTIISARIILKLK